ncbi:MAG: hypothetical protein AAF215_17535 [Cyanobacteria bacterium P01_A01_bin.123]
MLSKHRRVQVSRQASGLKAENLYGEKSLEARHQRIFRIPKDLALLKAVSRTQIISRIQMNRELLSSQ